MLSDRPDEAYQGWGLTRLDNWRAIAPAKNSVDERPQGHGAFRQGKIYRSAKVMPLHAFSECSSIHAAGARLDYLNGLVGQADTLVLRVTDEFGSTWREVSVVDADLPETPAANFTFTLDLLAVEPRRFGDPNEDTTGLPTESGGVEFPLTFPIDFGEIGDLGRLTLTNTGTADAWPRLIARGGLGSGFVAEEVGTGRVIELARTILIGSEVVIDFRTGTAIVDGGPTVSGQMIRRDWWSVPPGGSTTIQFTVRGEGFGTPTLRGELAPAFW
jgi:hypothetical protein